jgi:hypothetical protein
MSAHWKEISGLAAAWIGSIQLAQVQQVVGICSGLAVLVYTLIRIRIALRDGKDSE